jgi:hypothetical protein
MMKIKRKVHGAQVLQKLVIIPLIKIRVFPAFYEALSSLPCSEEPATGSCTHHLSPVHTLTFYIPNVGSQRWKISLQRFPLAFTGG